MSESKVETRAEKIAEFFILICFAALFMASIAGSNAKERSRSVGESSFGRFFWEHTSFPYHDVFSYVSTKKKSGCTMNG